MNIKILVALVFYSLLTYWAGPALMTMYKGSASTENSIVGAGIGFAVSSLLWSEFAKELAE